MEVLIVESYDKDEFQKLVNDLYKNYNIINIQYSTTDVSCLSNHGSPKIHYSAIVFVNQKSL